MSPFDSLPDVGTRALMRFTGGLVAYLLVHLLRLPVKFALDVLETTMRHIVAQLSALADQPAPARKPRPGQWGDRWGEPIPSTRARHS
ncbi:hypothetical protein [Amycolatopsis sp. NPDC059021]|uniref:hypothetical protein n=1 Tax=Amycolatopsis sp. NPDC059021 TaxID=3346704 RepID=UPI003670FFD0